MFDDDEPESKSFDRNAWLFKEETKPESSYHCVTPGLVLNLSIS